MDVGNFSISLAVADLATSLAFYKVFGFEVIAGNADQNWLILKNGDAKIGLFQGMFTDNLMTMNPPDARAIEAVAKAAGIEPIVATTGDAGPAHFIVTDPDGNTVMFDQHV